MAPIKTFLTIFLVLAIGGKSTEGFSSVLNILGNYYVRIIKTLSPGIAALPTISTTEARQLGTNYTTYLQIEKGLVNVIYSNNFTANTYNTLGGSECEGNEALGVLSTAIAQVTTNGTDFDSNFRGDYACSHGCNGECIAEPGAGGTSDSPASLYPFECKCSASGCDANGPKTPTTWWLTGTNVVCQKNDLCTCANVESNSNNVYTGYLCNWWNVAVNQTIILVVDSTFSPIRWCECCPNQ